MSNAVPKLFTVSEPFDSDTDADLIIQSCDNFEFRVRKAILSLASPVFKDMCSLPQPVPDDSAPLDTALPSIQLSESGFILDILLRYCYPVAPPLGTEIFSTVVAVLETSEKYDMSFITAKVNAHIEASYINDARYALLCYCRAYEHHEEAQTRTYAFNCLRFSLASLVSDLPSTSSGTSLSSLIIYHQLVSSQVASFLSSFEKVQRAVYVPGTFWITCQTCNIQGSEPKWWRDNLVSIVAKITVRGPTSRYILPDTTQCRGLCTTCRMHILEKWTMFEERFCKSLEQVARQVRRYLFIHQMIVEISLMFLLIGCAQTTLDIKHLTKLLWLLNVNVVG